MNGTAKGAIALLLVGLIVLMGLYLLTPIFKDKEQKATSDAQNTKGKIVIALDNWFGYFPIQSPEMKKEMRRNGWVINVVDDKADYATRMKQLQDGKIQFAVATVDSYILNAADLNFPGSIVMVIDESKGGDAILSLKDKVNSIDELKGNTNLRVGYTPLSPSHHLLKATSYHFSVPELLPAGDQLIETNGSEEALKKLLSGKVDVAVLWEPDVTRALSDSNVVKLLGTEDTEKLIVDVLLVNREFLKDYPGTVKQFLSSYFRVLKRYTDDSELLIKHSMDETGLTKDKVESMMKGVNWVNLTDNCEKWFGISSPGSYSDEGLISTIESSVDILINNGDFSTNPIPNSDPYRLTYSSILEDLYVSGISGFLAGKMGDNSAEVVNSIESRFLKLPDSAWSNLKEVGTLKVDPIIFQSGATELDLFAKEVIDKAVSNLKHYPNFRVIVKGHTGARGDEKANIILSQERADSVTRYIQVTYNVDENRIKSVGFGGNKLLGKNPDESKRSWEQRLSRVEIVLVREEF